MERFVLLMNPVCRRFTWRFRPHHSQHLSCFPCLEPISLAVCGFYLFIFFFICSGLNQMKELLLSLSCASHSRCPIFAVPRSCFRLYQDLPSLCVKLVWHRNEREGKKPNKKNQPVSTWSVADWRISRLRSTCRVTQTVRMYLQQMNASSSSVVAQQRHRVVSFITPDSVLAAGSHSCRSTRGRLSRKWVLETPGISLHLSPFHTVFSILSLTKNNRIILHSQ